MNLFALFNPTANQWCSKKWQECWGDLTEAATFTSRKNAETRLRAHRRKWQRYSESWIEQKDFATKQLSLWNSVVVKELTLVG